MNETLTARDIIRAWEEIVTPWVPMIRDAREVEVRASEFLEPGTAYALDCDAADVIWLPEPTGRVMVVCRPEDRETVERAVAEIRADTPSATTESALGSLQ